MTMQECRKIVGMGADAASAYIRQTYPDADDVDIWWGAVEAVEDEGDRGVGPAWDD